MGNYPGVLSIAYSSEDPGISEAIFVGFRISIETRESAEIILQCFMVHKKAYWEIR